MFYEEDYEWEEEQEIGECPVHSVYNYEEDNVLERHYSDQEIDAMVEVGITRLEAYLFSFCD